MGGWRIAMAGLLLACACPSARGQSLTGVASSRLQHAIVVEVGTGRVVTLPRVAANIFVADPKVAEVRPASARSLFVFGLSQGYTTIAALDPGGQTVGLFDVTIGVNSHEADGINRSLHAPVADSLADTSGVTATPGTNGVVLHGAVSDPLQAMQAVATTSMNLQAGHKTLDALTVASSATVGLKVRITEMTRQVTRDLGVDWTAIGSIGRFALNFATGNGVASTVRSVYTGRNLSVDTVIEALATDNLVRVLAEPVLTARSGESASFLVGGEYPIPVEQSGNSSGAITIEYKDYGVSLSFVPTVLSSGRISLHVRPEVSELATSTSAGAVTLAESGSTLSIPALTVSRAETTIELGSGQSFAIAGLLQDSTTQANNFTPGLGEVPILGALFRSDSYQHNQTELVIIVTPYIVGSPGDPDLLRDAGAGYTPPNDLERVLLLRQHGRAPPPPVPGDAGFIIR